MDGQPAQKGKTEDGYSSIMLVGDPYLSRAELRIDLDKENSLIATGFWILFLEITTKGGEGMAKWVHDQYPEAMAHGIAETRYGKLNITLEARGEKAQIFVLIVEPAK